MTNPMEVPNDSLCRTRFTCNKHVRGHLQIIGALEMILLRNDTEPIQQNIGERMAFVVGRNVNERKAIINNFRRIYSVRSKFLHHGVGSEE